MKFNRLVFILLPFFCVCACKENKTKSTTANEGQNPLNAESSKVELVLKMDSKLGEGAFWDHQSKQFYWVDILNKQLYIYNPETGENKNFEMPSRIGTVVPQTDSTAVVALDDGIYIQNIKSGVLSLLSDVEATKTENRFNDGKCDPNGNLWVGSMHLAEKEPNAKLYKITPEGNATAMLDSITISNGIVWTKDDKTMYYIDTPTAKIRAFDYDSETATISNERVAVKIPNELGYPDGMAIDSEDKLWVGMWNGNAVIRFDPKTGEVLEKIEVPAHNVTSCAFGGPELKTLYITTASVDMTPDEKENYPLAGSVFKVKTRVSGMPSTFFGTKK